VATLSVWLSGHHILVRAHGGAVCLTAVEVAGVGSSLLDAPREVAPADGAVPVAVRSGTDRRPRSPAQVTVKWIQENEPRTTIVTW
jgi:hypothetical protein